MSRNEQLRREGDRYAAQRLAEARAELETESDDEPHDESTLVPGAASAEQLRMEINIRDETDVSGAPRLRQLRVMASYNAIPPAPPDFANTPIEGIQPDEARILQGQVRAKIRELVALMDYDYCLTMAQLKVADAIARAFEKARDNTAESGARIAAQIAAQERADDGSEIRGEEIRRLRERRRMHAVQWKALHIFHLAALEERQWQVDDSGIDWPRYQSLRDMARANAERRDRRRLELAMHGMSEADYRKFLDQYRSTPLQTDGVDGADGEEPIRTAHEDVRSQQHRQRLAGIDNGTAGPAFLGGIKSRPRAKTPRPKRTPR